MIVKKKFKPFPLLSGFNLQTILPSLLPVRKRIPSETRYVSLEDQDRLAIEISTPKDWKGCGPTVVMLHGLTGSHQSVYMVRITKKLIKKGIRSVRVNLRGCGSGEGLSRKFYQYGSSDDLLSVLKYLKKDWPDSKTSLVGFSLGGNIVLKLAGELGSLAHEYVSQVIAVTPPVNISSTMKLLCHPKNKFYNRYFVKRLLSHFYGIQKRFFDLPHFRLPKNIMISEFDELYAAPSFGYSSNIEYYKASSSLEKIPNIHIPCKILLSEDDPIISSTDINEVSLPENVHVCITDKGGHMGYVGLPGKEFYWLDGLILSWIEF